MGWSFRKRVKILPGVRLNISKTGVGLTVGTKGVSVSVGKKGTYVNTSIPGTGLYKRQKIGGLVNFVPFVKSHPIFSTLIFILIVSPLYYYFIL